MNATPKRRWGDRKDAYRVRELDALHVFMPYLMPDRAANEAVANELIDLSAINRYLAKKNSENPQYKYTIFHVVCAALAKTIIQRPKMNRFIAGHRFYERKDISLTFVTKRQFTDDAHEAFAIIRVDKDSGAPTIDQIHDKICNFVYGIRQEGKIDGTTDIVEVFAKFPRFVLRIIMGILCWLDYHGWVPNFLSNDDPDYSTVFLSNLGSIKMNASYHHLVNWGTNSFFVVVGEKYKRPFWNDDGTFDLREVLPMGLTIDERIADGLYFAGSVKLMRYLLMNPELLERPVSEVIEYE